MQSAGASEPARAALDSNSTSAHCHVTDGTFTTCADGQSEWSDVSARVFPDTSLHLYADQADLDPGLGTAGSPADTFMLMYDECGRREPLGRDEYVLVSFKTVEEEDDVEKLEHYAIHLFADGTLIFLENGVPHRDQQGRLRVQEIEGQRGAVGFGPSTNCAFDHVVAEFQIALSATRIELDGGYSPDPIFWSSDPPQEEEEQEKECEVSPLPPITDPGAQQIEAAEQFNQIDVDGHRVNVSSRALLDGLQPETRAALLDFLRLLVNTPGAGTPTVTSAFRPQAYQDHLRAIRERADQLGSRVQGGQVTFTNDAAECAALRDAIAQELLGHRLGNNPVGRRSDHTLGNAFDISVTLPPGVNVDALAAQAGLHRPLPVRDPVHFVRGTPAGQRPGAIRGRSPVALLVVDPLGRRIGFDPAARAVVNEIGQGATYSGLGSEPQVFEFDDMLPGEYRVSGVATGSGPYAIEVVTADEDVTLDEGSVAGEATRRAPIAPVRVTVGGEGELTFETLAPPGGPPPALALRAGFDAQILPRNDDGSTGRVPLGFTVDFFGTKYDSVFVNNNGNVTFDAPLGVFTPFDLARTARAIIAPFFADVDTRVGNVVTYGQGTVDGRPAFGVTWPGVACFSQNTRVLNSFQLVLIARPGGGEGAFDIDIEFNYDSIQWEAGQASGGDLLCRGGQAARVGFSSGSGDPGTFFEVPGSGVPGAFLDLNPATGLIYNSLNSSLAGRYIFPVRSGVPATGADDDADGIADELDNCPHTANTDQLDRDQNGLGDACARPGQLHASAAFLQAALDGSTLVESTPLAIENEPSLLDQLVRIVEFRIDAGLTDAPDRLIGNLVASLVEAGAVEPGAADALVRDVLAALDSVPPLVTVTFPEPNGRNGWFVTAPVRGTVVADETTTGGSGVVDVVCTGAALGPVSGLGTASATAELIVEPDGIQSVECVATDGRGNTGAAPGSSAAVTVRVDTTAPTVTCTVSPVVLWPPNHRLVEVTAAVVVADALSGPAGFMLASVTSSEPDDGLGDGDTSGDIQGFESGTASTAGMLRAERAGTGQGRTYSLGWRGVDTAGNAASCGATVNVPHDHP